MGFEPSPLPMAFPDMLGGPPPFRTHTGFAGDHAETSGNTVVDEQIRGQSGQRKGPARFAECLEAIDALQRPQCVLKVLLVFPAGEKPSDVIFVVMARSEDAANAVLAGSEHVVRPHAVLKVQAFKGKQ